MLLLKNIQEYRSDIIMIQELYAKMFEELAPV